MSTFGLLTDLRTSPFLHHRNKLQNCFTVVHELHTDSLALYAVEQGFALRHPGRQLLSVTQETSHVCMEWPSIVCAWHKSQTLFTNFCGMHQLHYTVNAWAGTGIYLDLEKCNKNRLQLNIRLNLSNQKQPSVKFSCHVCARWGEGVQGR